MRFEIPPPAKVTIGDFVSIAPDGRKIAFFATDADRMPMVWVRPLDSREARPLAGTEGATNALCWSPDSRFLVFAAWGKLKKIEATGGPVQTLCDAATAFEGFWTLDNQIVFGTLGPLMRVPAVGGVPVPLTVVDHSRGEVEHVATSLLPDARHFLSLRLSIPFDKGGRLCHLTLAFLVFGANANSRVASLHGRCSASSLLPAQPPPSRLSTDFPL